MCQQPITDYEASDFYFHHTASAAAAAAAASQSHQRALLRAAYQQRQQENNSKFYYEKFLEAPNQPKPYPVQNTNNRLPPNQSTTAAAYDYRRQRGVGVEKHDICNGSDLINDNNNYFVTNYNKTTKNYHNNYNKNKNQLEATKQSGGEQNKIKDDRHLYHTKQHFEYSYGVKQVFIDSNPISKMQKEDMMIERSQLVNNESTNMPNDLDNAPNVGVVGVQPSSGATSSTGFSLHRSHHCTQVSVNYLVFLFVFCFSSPAKLFIPLCLHSHTNPASSFSLTCLQSPPATW